MKRFHFTAVCCVAIISLSLASCAVKKEVELTSTTLPADEVIAKNIEQLVVGATVDGFPDLTYVEVSDVKIVGKFVVEDQRHYQIYATMKCKYFSAPDAETLERQPDLITLQRLDTNKWVLRHKTLYRHSWQIVKE